MKVLVICDVHGTSYWKECISKINEYDHIVQLGDWFDNFHNDWGECNQIDNFLEAICLVKKYPEKFHVLLGNHDLNNYLMNELTSGHQDYKEVDIYDVLKNNVDYVNIAIELNGYVFSHAGFTKTWMKNNKFTNIYEVNKAFHEGNYKPFRFNGWDCTGDDITQGPTWVRPVSLIYDAYFKKQVIGHTEQDKPPLKYKKEDLEIYVVDDKKHKFQYEMYI